jgi:hypothetical protein
MTPEEATKELYRTIWRYEENTKVEDVERLLKNGAHLTGIVSTKFGLPIMMAIENRCDVRIIELMVKYSGVDMKYRVPCSYGIDLYRESTHTHIYKNIVVYDSIINTLLSNYDDSIGNSKISTTIFDLLYNQQYIDKPIKIEGSGKFDKELYEYTIECCKLLNIEETTLKNAIFDVPPDLMDFNIIPYDDQPYYWIYNRTLISDESKKYEECKCTGNDTDSSEIDTDTDCRNSESGDYTTN